MDYMQNMLDTMYMMEAMSFIKIANSIEALAVNSIVSNNQQPVNQRRTQVNSVDSGAFSQQGRVIFEYIGNRSEREFEQAVAKNALGLQAAPRKFKIDKLPKSVIQLIWIKLNDWDWVAGDVFYCECEDYCGSPDGYQVFLRMTGKKTFSFYTWRVKRALK